MSLSKTHWLFTAAMVGALTGHSTRAHACSGGGCIKPEFAPRSGRSVPASVNGLVLYRSFSYSTMAPVDLELIDSSGAPVPITTTSDPTSLLGPIMVVPTAPLKAGGSYRFRATNLTWDGTCLPRDDAQIPPMDESAFTVSESIAFPTRVGELAGSVALGPAEVGTLAGSCTSMVTASVVRLVFHPSAELVPYLGTAQVATYVDGVLWAASRFGEVGDDGSIPVPAEIQLRMARFPLTVFATCNAPNATDDKGLGTGHHLVELRVHLAGLATSNDPAPATMTVDLDCAAPGGTSMSKDGSRPVGVDGDAGQPITPASQGQSEPASTSDGGCAIGRGRGPAIPSALLALLLVRRARRRQGAYRTPR